MTQWFDVQQDTTGLYHICYRKRLLARLSDKVSRHGDGWEHLRGRYTNEWDAWDVIRWRARICLDYKTAFYAEERYRAAHDQTERKASE